MARATCHDQVRLVAREGADGDGDWVVAVLSRLPVRSADVVRVGPQLRRDPGRRAVVRAVVDVDGAAFTVVGTHMPLLKDPVWRLAPDIRAALPAPDEPGAFAGDMNMWGWCADRLAGPGWRRVGAGPLVSRPPAPQPDRPHPRERAGRGRVVRGGAPGHVRPPPGAGPPPLLTVARGKDGRMIDHLSIQCADVAASAAFYDRVLAPLGGTRIMDFGEVIGLRRAARCPTSGSGRGRPATASGSAHRVRGGRPRRRAGLLRRRGRIGAEVLHEPRVWPEYHEMYYGAFVRDPDGNNVEAVYHGPE